MKFEFDIRIHMRGCEQQLDKATNRRKSYQCLKLDNLFPPNFLNIYNRPSESGKERREMVEEDLPHNSLLEYYNTIIIFAF